MAGASYIRGKDGALRAPEGHSALWGCFGLSYASWLVLPRALMHEMPDDWQLRAAKLMQEFYDVYASLPEYDYHVTLRQNGRIAKMPDWVAYRYPDVETIESFKRQPEAEAA